MIDTEETKVTATMWEKRPTDYEQTENTDLNRKKD